MASVLVGNSYRDANNATGEFDAGVFPDLPNKTNANEEGEIKG
jgi:hypothetical protein